MNRETWQPWSIASPFFQSIGVLLIVILCGYANASLAVNQAVLPASTYGPVQSGEALWNIAGSLRPNAQISRQQVMLALLALNPQAFAHPCNINSLQSDTVLVVPSLAQLNLIDQQQALAEYQRQNQAWQLFARQPEQLPCSDMLTTIMAKLQSHQTAVISHESAINRASLSAEHSSIDIDNKAITKPAAQSIAATPTTSRASTAIQLPLHSAATANLPTVLPDPALRWLITLLIILVVLLAFLLWQAFLPSHTQMLTEPSLGNLDELAAVNSSVRQCSEKQL